MDIWIVSTFWLLWIILLWTLVIGTQMFVWVPAFNSLNLYLEVKFTGSYGNFIWNFLGNHHTVFHTGCIILPSYQQCTRVIISPYPPQHLIFSVFKIIALLIDVKWYFIVVLTCISLMISDVEHFFMCWLAICISLKKFLFKSFAH